MKQTVVSFADGAGNYLKAMARLEHSLKQTGFDGEFKGINDYGHIGARHHKEVPYQFKALAIKKAMEEGAELLLWCDSVVYATKSIQPIFDHIEKHGYLFFDNIGFSIGDYTSDACLSQHGMTREESFNSRMLMGCMMGFNLRDSKAQEFLDRYIKASQDGVSFMGSWTNNNLEVSTDMRCKGTRHDQSAASIIVKKMGLTLTNAQETFFAYDEHKGRMKVSDTVCTWSCGI